VFHKSLLVLITCLSLIFAYSFTAFPPITGANTFAINPVLFADRPNSGGTEVFFYYGLTDKWDVSTSITGIGDFTAMLRYDFGGSKILGLQASPSWVTPQFYLTLENDHYYLQGVVAAQFSYDYIKKPALYGILCPGFKLTKNIDFFCEVNPGYYMNEDDFANCSFRRKGAALDIVPGIGLTIGKVLFSIAFPGYNIYSANHHMATGSIGAWVYYSVKSK
jgi:hypothetical protein